MGARAPHTSSASLERRLNSRATADGIVWVRPMPTRPLSSHRRTPRRPAAHHAALLRRRRRCDRCPPCHTPCAGGTADAQRPMLSRWPATHRAAPAARPSAELHGCCLPLLHARIGQPPFAGLWLILAPGAASEPCSWRPGASTASMGQGSCSPRPVPGVSHVKWLALQARSHTPMHCLDTRRHPTCTRALHYLCCASLPTHPHPVGTHSHSIRDHHASRVGVDEIKSLH